MTTPEAASLLPLAGVEACGSKPTCVGCLWPRISSCAHSTTQRHAR